MKFRKMSSSDLKRTALTAAFAALVILGGFALVTSIEIPTTAQSGLVDATVWSPRAPNLGFGCCGGVTLPRGRQENSGIFCRFGLVFKKTASEGVEIEASGPEKWHFIPSLRSERGPQGPRISPSQTGLFWTGSRKGTAVILWAKP